MLKLTLVLCAVFFGSAASVPFRTFALDNVKSDVRHSINATNDKLVKLSTAMQDKGYEVAKKVSHQATNFYINICNELLSIVNETVDEFNKRTSQGKNSITSKCIQMINDVKDNAAAIMENMEVCITAANNNILNYIKVTNKIFDEALVKLIEIGEKAEHCDDDAYDVKSSLAAIPCVVEARMNATALLDKMNLMSTKYDTELLDLLETIELSLDDCRMNSRFTPFIQETLISFKNIKNCMRDSRIQIYPARLG